MANRLFLLTPDEADSLVGEFAECEIDRSALSDEFRALVDRHRARVRAGVLFRRIEECENFVLAAAAE